MLSRSVGLYTTLFTVMLVISLGLLAVSFTFESASRYATMIISLFFLVMALAYFQLSKEG